MSDRFLNPVILITSVLFSLAANLSGASSAHSISAASPDALWTLVAHPARLVNGMPVLFRVTTPKPVRALSGNWLGHEIAFSFDASHKSWFALPGARLGTHRGATATRL